MATTIIIKAEVDTGESVSDLVAADKALNKLASDAEKLSKNTKAFLKEQKAVSDPNEANRLEALSAKICSIK